MARIEAKAKHDKLTPEEQKAELKKVNDLIKHHEYVPLPKPQTSTSKQSNAFKVIMMVFQKTENPKVFKEICNYFYCPECPEGEKVFHANILDGTGFLNRHVKRHERQKANSEQKIDDEDKGETGQTEDNVEEVAKGHSSVQSNQTVSSEDLDNATETGSNETVQPSTSNHVADNANKGTTKPSTSNHAAASDAIVNKTHANASKNESYVYNISVSELGNAFAEIMKIGSDIGPLEASVIQQSLVDKR